MSQCFRSVAFWEGAPPYQRNTLSVASVTAHSLYRYLLIFCFVFVFKLNIHSFFTVLFAGKRSCFIASHDDLSFVGGFSLLSFHDGKPNDYSSCMSPDKSAVLCTCI